MKPFDFRTHQVLSDLRALCRFLEPEGLFPNPALAAEFSEWLDASSAAGKLAFSKELNDALWMAAVSPELQRDAFLTSTAALLMGSLQNTQFPQDLSWFWEDFNSIYRTAPPPVRAALMNGYERLRHNCLLSVDCKPAQEDLLTRSLSEVEDLLIPIARRMTPAEIESIAAADYGMDKARHKTALEELLDSPSLAYPKGEVWYPAEVIELTSYVQGAAGWLPCTAIVLLDAVRTLDDRSNAEFNFGGQWRDYSRLPALTRSAVHAAFRYLYESDEFWDPSFKGRARFKSSGLPTLDWGIQPACQ
ncbi:methylmalonyl-CoA mutase [Roseobacter sp. SK209-2-6]|nr:methylmalonyl-CoA mutase [Roseobacter sp. SK209-2-6]